MIIKKCKVLLKLAGFSAVEDKLYKGDLKIDETVDKSDYILKIVSKEAKVINLLLFRINIEYYQHSTKFWNLPPECSVYPFEHGASSQSVTDNPVLSIEMGGLNKK